MRKFSTRWSAFAGMAALATATVAFAATPALASTPLDTFTNGTFEPGTTSAFITLGAGAGSPTYISDWTVKSGNVDLIGTYWQQPPGGGYSLDMNGNIPGAISQQFDTTAGVTYAVQFYLAGNPAGGPATKTLDVSATGGPLVSVGFTNTSNTSLTSMGWVLEDYTFIASGSSTTLTFTSTTTSGSPQWYGPAIGEVSVTPIAASGAECKDGGWQTLYNPSTFMAFQNQGACVSYFAISSDTPIGS